MSLPAASAPVAVLVLAWNETTPAVRALVEAAENPAPALDSVVVLVPAGPATAELTPEEFLPLEASIDLPLVVEPLAALAAAAPPTPEAPATAPAATSQAALPTGPLVPAPAKNAPIAPLGAAAPATTTAPAQLALADALAALPAAEPAPALAAPLPSVRVLRLNTYSLASLAAAAQQALPAPAWTGAASFPTAPYLGSITVAPSLPPVAEALLGLATLGPAATPASALPGAKPAPTPREILASTRATAGTSPAYSPTAPAALAAELDIAPTPTATALVPAAETATTRLGEVAAVELTDTLAVDVTPAQADWSAALASLQKPATIAEATQPPAAEAEPAPNTQLAEASAETPAAAPEQTAPAVLTLPPAAHTFDAPNLNFQIIQYARFAVPLALAEPPFDVIYAPAWPTWLAAQELRQRTGQPLVLHVTALAAAEGEPIALAAGWVAEIQRQALHRADLILTETPALAARLRHELALPAHRVRPVPAAEAEAVAQALRTARPNPA